MASGHDVPKPRQENNPNRLVGPESPQYTAFINKGGKMTGVSDEEYNTWRTNRKAHQERYGHLGGEYGRD
jgi:hypothetical protein